MQSRPSSILNIFLSDAKTKSQQTEAADLHLQNCISLTKCQHTETTEMQAMALTIITATQDYN